MRTIELLAPAKDKDTAFAAINYGADAVYIGGPAFGARAQAGNTMADIAEIVRHAHLYAAKIYVTVNTLLLGDELAAARKLIGDLYEAGVDAVIIQDAGLLAGELPPVALHASTQMHNNTVDKVRFLAQIGVKRVVLPREFSLAEIRAMHAAVPEIELEAFVHGALCVSYSGQCYMSYAAGGRSANRGQCAQPCRKKYSLMDEQGKVIAKDKYLLSLKDLCLADYLEALLDAGVSSFKIEGRLKNTAYVKNVVAFYRQRIDAILTRRQEFAGASTGKVYFDFEPNLNKTFNRQYTDYFINGRHGDITQFETPKALGEKLGRVKHSKNGLVLLDNAKELTPGDGLCWFEEEGLKGANVNKVTPQGFALHNSAVIKAGADVYRNFDHKFVKTLDNSKTMRKIALDLQVDVDAQGLTLAAVDEDGLAALLPLTEALVPAQDAVKAVDNWRKAFAKLGDTPFELRSFKNTANLPFMPMSRLNALRRELAAKITDVRLLAYRPKPVQRNPEEVAYPAAELNFTANVVNDDAAAFYERHGAPVLERGAESGLDLHGRTIMTTKHCLRFSFGCCPKVTHETASNWYLLDDKGQKYALDFDCNNCHMHVNL